jgi:hypothetical protein
MNPPRNRTPLSLALAAAAGLGLSGDAGLLASAPRALAGVARVMAGGAPLLLALEAQATTPATGAPAAAGTNHGRALSLRLAASPESTDAPLQVAGLSVREEPIPGEPGATLIRPLTPAAPAPKLDREAAVAALDTRVLADRVSATAPPNDAFAPRSWAPPPPPAPPPAPPAPPAPPEAPVAPPLPFRYVGMMEESETSSTVYLAQGERLITAAPGDTIDNTYRVDALKGRTLHFTYLPLNQRQSLPLGPVTP